MIVIVSAGVLTAVTGQSRPSRSEGVGSGGLTPETRDRGGDVSLTQARVGRLDARDDPACRHVRNAEDGAPGKPAPRRVPCGLEARFAGATVGAASEAWEAAG